MYTIFLFTMFMLFCLIIMNVKSTFVQMYRYRLKVLYLFDILYQPRVDRFSPVQSVILICMKQGYNAVQFPESTSCMSPAHIQYPYLLF